MGLDAGVSLARFLLRLAECNLGLVVISTREQLANVEGHATTEEQKLDKLSHDAAVRWCGGGAACGVAGTRQAAGVVRFRLRPSVGVSQAVSRSTGTGYSMNMPHSPPGSQSAWCTCDH